MKKFIKYILLAIIILSSVSINTVSAQGVFDSSPDLKLGSVSPYVVQLQKYLNSHGYIVNTISGQPGSIGFETDTFGTKTKKALINFQTANGIVPASGYFGVKTKAIMVDVYGLSNVNKTTAFSAPVASAGSAVTFPKLTVTAGDGGTAKILVVHTTNSNPDATYKADPTFNASVVSADKVTITAVPDDGYEVYSWSGSTDCQDLDKKTECPQFVMGSSDKNVTINFATTTSTTTFKLTIKTNEGTGSGSVSADPLPTDGVYASGTVVTLTPEPNADSEFGCWSEGLSCALSSGAAPTLSTLPKDVTMTSDKTVSAMFNLKPLKLTVQTGGTGKGTVTSDIAGVSGKIDCGEGKTKCTESYDKYKAVTLTAKADADSTFVGWSGACKETSGNCTVYMYGEDISVKANFDKKKKYKLTLSIDTKDSGDESGSVSGATDGQEFASGTVLTLKAKKTADTDSVDWTGCDSSVYSAEDCTVTMIGGDKRVYVVFWNKPLLTINKTGTGSGSVSGGDSGKRYNSGTSITLTATADTDSTFDGWSGDTNNLPSTSLCNGTSTCTFRMKGLDRSINAIFTKKNQYTLTTGVDPSGVSENYITVKGPSPTYSSGPKFYEGDSVTLTATAGTNYTFNGWSGTCSGNTCGASRIVVMSSDKSLTANFLKKIKGGGGGIINGGGTGGTSTSTPKTVDIKASISGGSNSGVIIGSNGVVAKPISAQVGSQIVLTATPNSGYTFVGWSNCSSVTSNICTVSVQKALTVTATFKAIPTYKLTVKTTSSRGAGGSVTGITGSSQSFPLNTNVVLTAVPKTGSKFKAWSNCSAPVANVCTVKMDRSKTVYASFSL